MTIGLKEKWDGLPSFVRLGILILILAFIANSALGTATFIETLRSHYKDRRFDKDISERERRIEELESQSAKLKADANSDRAKAQELKLQLEAKDALIAEAGSKVQAKDKLLEEVVSDHEKDKARIDATTDPDAIADELRQRLRRSGLIKE